MVVHRRAPLPALSACASSSSAAAGASTRSPGSSAQSPRVDAVVLRAGQRRHRAASPTCVPVAADDVDGLLARFARGRAHRPDRRRPRAAAHARASSTGSARRGCASSGRPRAAAQLEGSKAFTKELLRRARRADRGSSAPSPTPTTAAALRRRGGGAVVVKADGLAAGKGVFDLRRRSTRRDDGRSTRSCATRLFGDAGARVVIEEFLDGEEVSFMALTDGDTVAAAGVVAGSQARLRRRPRRRTPAAWAPTRRRRW